MSDKQFVPFRVINFSMVLDNFGGPLPDALASNINAWFASLAADNEHEYDIRAIVPRPSGDVLIFYEVVPVQ